MGVARGALGAGALPLLAACAASPALKAPGDGPRTFVTSYVCAEGTSIRVEQPVTRMAGQPITLTYREISYPMAIAPSGSGSKYVNQANQLEWFAKGDEGRFLAKGCKVASSKS